MTTILDKIAAYKREEVAKAKAEISERELEVMALDAPPLRSFKGALDGKDRAGRMGSDRRDQEGEPVQGTDPRQISIRRSSPWPMRREVPPAFRC